MNYNIQNKMVGKKLIRLFLLAILISGFNNFSFGQTTFTSALSGNWNVGSTWIGGVAPGATDNAIIAGGTTVTLAVTNATIHNLTINTGGVLNGENKTMFVNGKLIVDGTYTSKITAARDFEFNGDSIGGTGSMIINFSGADFNINTNAVIVPSSRLIVYGNVNVGVSVTVINKGQIEVTDHLTGSNATTSIWTNFDNSYLAVGNTLLTTGILNTTASGNTVEYNNIGDQNIKTPSTSTYHNILIRGAGNKNILTNITANGNLEINNSATLISNNFSFQIKGNWTNFSNFTEGAGIVSFTGTGNQNIINPVNETFYNLIINKTGGEVILGANVIISNTLTMTNGVINSATYKTTLGTGTGQLGTLSYSGGYIKGKFEKWINNIEKHHFPVGATNPQRIWITPSGLNSGGTLIAEFIQSDPGNSGLSLDDAGTTIYNTFVEGYWTIDNQNGFNLGGGNTFDMQLDGAGFTSFPIDANTRILSRPDGASNWVAEGAHLAGIGTTARRTVLTTLPAHFALGDDTNCAKPVTSVITGTDEVCSSQSAVTYSVVDNPPNTYSWTIVGGVQNPIDITNSITVDWGATGMDGASVTVVESNACTNGAPVTMPVTIHSVPPESISGNTIVAEFSPGVSYSVVNRPGYTYQWSIVGGSQVSGGNTNNITVNWGANGDGSVTVIAELTGCSLAPPVILDIRLYDVIESAQTGFWDDPATWDCVCEPLTTESVRIKNGHTVSLHAANDIEITNFIIDLGGALNYQSRPFKVHGDFIINGNYDGGSGKVLTLDGIDTEIEGVGTVTGGFTIPSGNKSISSTTVMNIDAGNITIGSLIFVTNNGKIILGGNIVGTDATTTWVNSDNSALEISGSLLSTGTLRAFAAGNHVNYTGGNQTIKTPLNSIYHDLTSSGSLVKSLSGSLIVDGNITINATSTLDVTVNNYSINIKGNWTNSGAAFNPRSGNVTFDGTAAQSITGVENFYNMLYQNVTGDLTLNNNVVVRNNFEMAGKDIYTGSNVLQIGFNAANIGSLTYSSGILIGTIERWANSFGNILFPVGKAGSYNPANIYINVLTTAGSVTGEFIAANPGSSGLPLVDGTTNVFSHFSDGYWSFTAKNGFASSNFNTQLNAINFTSYAVNVNTRILKRTNGGNWFFDGTHSAASPPTVYRNNLTGGISALGTQFGLGFACAPYTVTGVVTNAKCFGSSDGAIDITVSGGKAPYTFSWVPGGATTEDISGLTAGSYGVTVTDANGCITPAIFNVMQPANLVINEVVTNVTCIGSNDGAIDITVAGGTAPYIYGWSTLDGSGLVPSAEDQTGLSIGTYSALVLDANGCSITKDISIVLGDYTGPALICPGDLTAICDISERPAYSDYAAFVAAGGSASDACGINSGSFALLTETSTGTCPETVTRTYYIEDINGNSTTCSQDIVINDIINPTASNPLPVSVQCIGDVPAPDITVVTDEADNCPIAPVVAWVSDVSDAGSCPEVITRTYSVTDACGNSINVTQTITVDDDTNPTASNPAPVSVQCISDVPASDITVVTDEADNCTAAPTVSWFIDVNNGGSGTTVSPYIVTRTYRVTDDCGNFINVIQTITAIDNTAPVPDVDPLLDVTGECTATALVAPTATDNCGGVVTVTNDATLPITAQGTTVVTWTYTDVNSNFSTQTQNVVITDVTAPVFSGCPADMGPLAMDPLTCGATVTWTDPTANDNCDGVVAVVRTDVTGLNSGDLFPTGITTISYSSTDGLGNISSCSFNVTVDADIEIPVVSCVGDQSKNTNTGSCDYTVVGTEFDATAIDNCSVLTLVNNFNGLSTLGGVVIPIGVTTVIWTATDASGNTGTCQFDITVTDNELPTIACPSDISQDEDAGFSYATVIVPDATIADNCTISILTWDLTGATTATSPATGINQIGTYAFNTGVTTVTYIISDATGNSTTCNFVVTVVQPLALSGSITSQTDVLCYSSSTGSVTVEGLGGVTPYEYSLDGGTYQSSGTFVALAAGTYTVTVQDVALTTFDVSVTITEPGSSVGGSVTFQTDVLCFGNNTGSVTVSASGGTSPYQYKLGSGSFQASGTFGSLAAGNYTITVQDANLCSIDMPITITQPVIDFTGSITSQTDVSCSGSSDGSVTVAGAGGTSPYEYSIDGVIFQASGIFDDIAASAYTITVRDANLCITSVLVNITEPAALSIANTKVDASCPGTADGSISLTITGGTQPYSAIWSDGIATADRLDIPDGTYTVVVSDLNGCAASLDVIVDVTGSEQCIEIPQIITPNNDGYNDTWIIKNIDLFPDAEVFVFSRWGKRVFKTKNIMANPWDGTLNGKTLPTDSYHYILHLNDGSEPRSGVISIIR